MTSPVTRHGGATTELPGRPGIDVVIALLVSIPPLICLLLLGGIPTSSTGWAALLGPVIGAAAVLACRRKPWLAALLLTLALLCVPAAESLYRLNGSLWVQFISLAPIAAAAVVYCALGLALPLAPSLVWVAGSVAVSWWALGGDAVYLLLGAGWWVIGRVLRSRQEVADNLRIRAAELGAERERFTAEAIRIERAKIARELHDIVAHCMTVIVIQSRAGQHLVGRDPGAAKEAMDVILAVAAESESDITALVELMDPQRSRRLTRQLLDELVSRAGRTGAAITVEISVDPDQLPNEVAVAAHRLVQEAITNAFRHAPGARIVVELSGGEPLFLKVTNWPVPAPQTLATDAAANGPSLARSGAGRGLVGLQERIDGVGGTVCWGPTPTGGWQVAAIFPPLDDPSVLS